MRKANITLWLIFLLVLGVRLWIVFRFDTYSYDAYFHIRQIKVIASENFPDFYDRLSYGGREIVYLPIFHIVIANFVKIFPLDIVLKILPNLMASLLVFSVYLVTKSLTDDNNAALFSAFISGFIPIYLSETLLTVSPLCLFLPLIFLETYFFIEGRINYFLITSVVLALIHPASIILAFVFGLYYVMQRIEHFKSSGLSREMGAVYSAVSILVLLFAFRTAFLNHGYNTIFQNLPTFLADTFFQNLTLSGTLTGIGFLPIIIGTFAIYWNVFHVNNPKIYFYLSFAFVIGILLWIKLIPISLGISVLGIIFVIFFGVFYKQSMDFLSQTKISHYKMLWVFIIVIIFLITSLLPAFKFTQEGLVTEEELGSMNWIYFHTEDNSTIMAPLKYGYMINAQGGRKNIADGNFILAKNINQRISDINAVYSSSSLVDVVEVLEKYGAKYIYVPAGAKLKFDIPDCMTQIYNADVKIFENGCVAITRRVDLE